MSQAPTPSTLSLPNAASGLLRTPSGGAVLRINARIAEVQATLGYVPPAVLGAVHERIFDMMNHHRRSVLKHQSFPAKRRAQKMLGARLYRYGAKVRNPTRFDQLRGESFAVEPSGAWGTALGVWERGGVVYTSKPMAIPFASGLSGQRQRGDRVSKKFKELLSAGLFDVSPGGTLFVPTKTRRKLAGTQESAGERSIIYGALRRHRRQPAMLGFYAAFERNLSVHLRKLDRDLAMAMNLAGREALKERYREGSGHLRGTYEGQYKAELRRFLEANGAIAMGARRMIQEAREEARRQSEQGSAA